MAIIDNTQERRDKALEQYPDCFISKETSEILNISNLSAVVVATPVETHFDIVKTCLENGLHVLCEKVLCSNLEQVYTLVNLSIRQKKILDVDYTFLQNSIVRKIHDVISTEGIGTINYLTFKRTGLGPIRKDVNVIYDLLSHDISILVYWLGIPEWVIATERCILNNEKSDIAFVQAGYNNGIIANFQVSWLNPMKQRIIEVVGEKGMLIFDDTNTLEKLKIINTGSDYLSMVSDFESFQLSLKSGDIIIPNIFYPEPLKEKVNSFLSNITISNINNHQTIAIIKNNSMVLEAIRLSAVQNSVKIYI